MRVNISAAAIVLLMALAGAAAVATAWLLGLGTWPALVAGGLCGLALLAAVGLFYSAQNRAARRPKLARLAWLSAMLVVPATVAAVWAGVTLRSGIAGSRACDQLVGGIKVFHVTVQGAPRTLYELEVTHPRTCQVRRAPRLLSVFATVSRGDLRLWANLNSHPASALRRMCALVERKCQTLDLNLAW